MELTVESIRKMLVASNHNSTEEELLQMVVFLLDRMEELVECINELYDVQDHEDWCGHGKAGCIMCKVISNILHAVEKFKIREGGK